jgi:hypothetical protein
MTKKVSISKYDISPINHLLYLFISLFIYLYKYLQIEIFTPIYEDKVISLPKQDHGTYHECGGLAITINDNDIY